jgi:hypothetical protein
MRATIMHAAGDVRIERVSEVAGAQRFNIESRIEIHAKT